ncbi:hypothetical protein ON010_g13405 [Phytophthora cinnamomi]|nr:hypothetical protein ON010_g13405 [Phytophthora cinnamomi]
MADPSWQEALASETDAAKKEHAGPMRAAVPEPVGPGAARAPQGPSGAADDAARKVPDGGRSDGFRSVERPTVRRAGGGVECSSERAGWTTARRFLAAETADVGG